VDLDFDGLIDKIQVLKKTIQIFKNTGYVSGVCGTNQNTQVYNAKPDFIWAVPTNNEELFMAD